VRSLKELIQRWTEKKPADARATLLERHRKSAQGPDDVLLVDQPGVEKMSEVLGDFAKPWLAGAKHEEVEGILTAAVLAWNMALLSERECELEFQEKFVPRLDRPNQIMMRKMITRKRTGFARNDRMILDFEIGWKGELFDLQVITTMDEKDLQKQLSMNRSVNPKPEIRDPQAEIRNLKSERARSWSQFTRPLPPGGSS